MRGLCRSGEAETQSPGPLRAGLRREAKKQSIGRSEGAEFRTSGELIGWSEEAGLPMSRVTRLEWRSRVPEQKGPPW